MSNINKQELREAAERAEPDSWGYDRDEFNEALTPSTVLALLDELEAAEKRIAELSASHGNLREAMAGIHNTITAGGAYTPLAAILNSSKRAYEESAAAAGKGE
ncbi:TPA: ead/Ea22-like family protein [Enterobacter cloacae subsp. cloacae]|nr:ead/Ea22-like family protein [Enterobacter cloacae subsp. cloacae]